MAERTGDGSARSDRLFALAVFGIALFYWSAWPQNLGTSDESHFYYHSVRVLHGDVPYRDFFEFYMPLSFYAMALVFGAFGVKLGVAKAVTALVHAATATLVYVGSRKLGVRREIAGVFALGFLALGPPTWHFGSPHWIAACLMVAAMTVLVGSPATRGRLVATGCLVGLLASVQQQAGLPIALGIGGAIAFEHWLDRRFALGPSQTLLVKLWWFAAPVAGITALVLFSVMIVAGPGPVVYHILVYPFTNYRGYVGSDWGGFNVMSHPFTAYTFPWILKTLPPLVIAAAIAWIGSAWRVGERSAFGAWPTLLCYALATVATALYYPDFIHLAFVVAVFLVPTAAVVERIASLLPRGAVLIAMALSAVAIAVQLAADLERAETTYAFPGETAFGRVDFETLHERELFERVRDQLATASSRELFCYPVRTSLFLTADAVNPSRHPIMIPGYLSPDEYSETIATLERRQVETAVIVPEYLALEDDPMAVYLRDHYRCADDASPCWVYRRGDPVRASDPSG